MASRKIRAPRSWTAGALTYTWAAMDEQLRFGFWNDAYQDILAYLLVFSNRLWNRYGFLPEAECRKERAYVMQGYEWVLREMEEVFGKYTNPKWPAEDWYCDNWDWLGGWQGAPENPDGTPVIDPAFINFVKRYVSPWNRLGLTDAEKEELHGP